MSLNFSMKRGVLSGNEANELFEYAKEKKFAIPAVNVVGTNSINSVLEASKAVDLPVIVQISHGGAAFFAGKGLPKDKASIVGAISMAHYVHKIANYYGVTVILNTDHANRGLLPWIDELLNEC